MACWEMSPNQTSIRVLRNDEMSFTREARMIQRRALAGNCRVVKLGPLVFFSTPTGDAWILDPEDGCALCLARDHETRPVPIRETATKVTIEWNAEYKIEDEVFTVTEEDGSARTIMGYPTAEIQRLIREYPASQTQDFARIVAALERHDLGRNDPCPCGSGKKYKKCCLAKDEALIRRSSAQSVRRAEAVIHSSRSAPDMAAEDPASSSGEALIEETETEPPPEVPSKLDELWGDFNALKRPTTEQLDAFLSSLLASPPEATSWCDLFHRLARQPHAELPGVFRRIASAVPHTKDTGMGFFYWAAAEEFVSRGLHHLLPEVAAHFRKLDSGSYDADALDHLEDYLLAEGFEAEALELAEHFLPVMRADEELMPHAVPDLCNLIFELRVGRRLRGDPNPEPAPKLLARELRQGIEGEIHRDAARNAAGIITSRLPVPVWTRSQFDLVSGEGCTENEAWRESLRLFGTLMQVAREAWEVDQRPPGCTLRGLTLMLNSVYDWLDAGWKKRKNASGNFLDYLGPAGLEERLVWSCPELIGINERRARLLLDAHALLLRCAIRHELITSADAARTEKELGRLESALRVGRA